VYAVDTAYGELAWKLRQDPRVVVMERRNALHVEPPPEAIENCDLVSLDLGWTKQERAIPAALRWLKAAGGRRAGEQESRRAGKDKAGSIPGAAALPGGAALPGAGAGAGARIVTLIKPHYESGRHRLSDEEADEVTRGVVEDVLPRLGDGLDVLGWMRSPIRGGKGKNLEHLAVMGWKSEG
jgi:23S rRNA (cytidine1920-2'-O)/16S rRNA (cytidine1409-2'-O)-methyltransferase